MLGVVICTTCRQRSREYEDNWEEYYSLVLKWAYKKDLLPNNKD